MWYKEVKKMMGEELVEDVASKNFAALLEGDEDNARDEGGKEKADKEEAADAEINGNATPATTETSDDRVTNGSKDQIDTNSQKSKQSNETEKAEPESSPIYEDTPWQTGPCDGICDRDLRDYDKGIYMCIHCTCIWLCVECWEKHKEGPLPSLLCDSDHDFVYVTGPPKNLCVEKGKEEIWVGGKVRDMREWLGSIWERWGVGKNIEGKEDVVVKI
jgi:hypothetical protein